MTKIFGNRSWDWSRGWDVCHCTLCRRNVCLSLVKISSYSLKLFVSLSCPGLYQPLRHQLGVYHSHAPVPCRTDPPFLNRHSLAYTSFNRCVQGVHRHHSKHVESRSHFVEVGVFLPSYGFRGWNPECQAWLQKPLPAEASLLSIIHHFFFFNITALQLHPQIILDLLDMGFFSFYLFADNSTTNQNLVSITTKLEKTE